MLQVGFKCKAVLIYVIIYVILCDVVNKINANDFESKCVFASCDKVVCEAIIDEEIPIANHINQAIQIECNDATLDIKDSVFKDFILRQNWLSTLKQTIKIRMLTLDNCTIHEIEKGAFSSHPFTYLAILYIKNSGLKTIKQDLFEGLSFLTTFGFKSNFNSYELMVEEQALKTVNNSLSTVEIDRFTINEKSLINLFGINGPYLPRLQILDLRDNNIEKIPENAFKNAYKLKKIYLDRSSIREVDEKAFWENTVLTLLQLANNSIETLKPLTFKNLASLTSLSLDGNYWDCICSLQWLKDLYLTTNIISKQNPLQCSNGISFINFDFCLMVEVTTDLQTSTDLSPLYTTLQCQVTNSLLSVKADVGSVYVVDLLIKNEVITLEFQELELEPLQVKIIVSNIASDALRNYFLLWFNSNNKSDYGCITPINNNTLITDLNRATTYSFSLVKENETETSPKASFGFTTLPEWSQRAWILNSKRTLVLVLTTIFMILLGCLAAIFTFFCLRMHHDKSINSDTLDGLPKNNYGYIDNASTKEYEKPTYWEPYVTTSNPGYLTPKHNKYDKIRYKPSLSRSVSEWSIYTTSAIYDEYNCKGTDIWSTSQYKKRANFKQNRMNRYDEFKPPLPPPNVQIHQ